MAEVTIYWKDRPEEKMTTVENVEYQSGAVGVFIRTTDTEWSFVPYVNTWYIDFKD